MYVESGWLELMCESLSHRHTQTHIHMYTHTQSHVHTHTHELVVQYSVHECLCVVFDELERVDVSIVYIQVSIKRFLKRNVADVWMNQ